MSQIELKTISRYFSITNIPRPIELNLNFEYNFFVPDEAISDDSDPALIDGNSFTYSYLQKDDDGNKYMTDPVSGKKLLFVNGKLVTADVLTRIHPRLVELKWELPGAIPAADQGTLPTIQSLYQQGKIIKEEEISSVFDASLRTVDTEIRDRLYRKGNLLGKMCTPYFPNASYEVTARVKVRQRNQFAGFSNSPSQGIPSDTTKFKRLFDLNVPEGVKRVNDLGKTVVSNQFKDAEEFSPDFQYDRRLIEMASNSSIVEAITSSRKVKQFVKNQASIISALPSEPTKQPFVGSSDVDYNSTISNILTETPHMKAEVISERFLSQKTVTGENKKLQFAVIGYIVERHEFGALNAQPTRKYFVESGLNKNFVDTDVIYGETYYYAVRAVYVREDSVKAYDETGAEIGQETIRQYISSRPSLVDSIEIVETTPPVAPDGIFFKFNYRAKKGLIINWQYPVGRSRDTKYFQVFRRKTIHEPFQCIAEIDFNNALIKTERREKVREEKVIKSLGPVTFYEDSSFDRNSSYIYAIASIDAHGLSSGYSYQTRVTFNRSTNKIELKAISRSGAPKQYPNFYVDPDEDENLNVFSLTQDVITSSGKQKIKIYLDPDCEKYVLPTGETRSLVNLTAASSGGPVYKMHLINLDRHKDETLEIRIKDERKE